MREVRIKKAQRTLPDQPHESVTIVIDEEIADPPKGQPIPDLEAMMRGAFGVEARTLFEALRASLPGGTLDRLLVELLADRASLLVVPATAVGYYDEMMRYKAIILKSGLWRKVNFFPGQRGCMLCGYNGELFFQPNGPHACATEAARLGEGGGLL